MTKNEVDINKVVRECYVTPDSLYDGPYTKTTQFMLPAIGINIKSKLIFNFFVNTYIEDSGIRHNYKRPIFVLFAVTDFSTREWSKVYSTLVKTDNYIHDYDVGIKDEKKLVMMVFKVPDEFEQDYYHFKRGRYSQFSEAFKAKFPRYIGDGKESLLWQAINKAPELKRKIEDEFLLEEGQMDWPDATEIWDKPRKEREYYRYGTSLPG